MGYNATIVNNAHPKLLQSFCGVGNPFLLGNIRPGVTVLDFGCGAGFDLYVAAGLVGKQGWVCGVDLTDAMADLARQNLSHAVITNFEIRILDSEKIPCRDNSFDVVLSNGVINLTPDKRACFIEILRVLRPGGRLQFADVVLEKELPAAVAGSADAWSQ